MTHVFNGAKWQSLASIPLALDNFEHMSICLLLERNFYQKISRYLTWVCHLGLRLFNLISGSCSICFQANLNIISSILVSINDSPFPLNRWATCFNLLLMIYFIVPSFSLGNTRLVSSTKWWKIDLEDTHYRSLMY